MLNLKLKMYKNLGFRDFDNKIMEYCFKHFTYKHPNIPKKKNY